jgi:carbamoyltransferase
MRLFLTAFILFKLHFDKHFAHVELPTNWTEIQKSPVKVSTKFIDEYVLGINAYFHDSSATIVKNGEILWAAQEERFTRKKNDSRFPFMSIARGLKQLNLKHRDISAVIYFENPFEKSLRVSQQLSVLGMRERFKFVYSNAYRLLLHSKLFSLKFRFDLVRSKIFWPCISYNKIFFSNHHLSHAASAFLPSGFNEAAIICIDAVGETTTTSILKGNLDSIQFIRTMSFPNSIGLLYSTFTAYCGFKVNSGEYKLMGLAPFGEPKYKDKILNKIVFLHPDGSFKINSDLLPFSINEPILTRDFIEYWGREPRSSKAQGEIEQFYCDVAASIQAVLNDYLVLIANQAKLLTGSENVCLAGGVALNCVANSFLAKQKIFKNIWIQPAAGDSGTSLGAALMYSAKSNNYDHRESINRKDTMLGSFLGSYYSDNEIQVALNKYGLSYEAMKCNQLIRKVAGSLNDQKIIGHFQNRMEFGPRALGSRSILANPRDPKGQRRINLAVKFRESFRPFAPAMLSETAEKYFDIKIFDPYMLFTWKFKKEYRFNTQRIYDLTDVNLIRSEFPSITHVDYSARVQIVQKNDPLHNLLEVCNEIYDLPMLVNTSFNVRGEPIVESPSDAIECFLTTDIDCLAIGGFWIEKFKQNNLQQIKKKEYLD